jgi:hypothetical protein
MEARMFVSPMMLLLLPYVYWKMWMDIMVRPSLSAAQHTMNDVAEAGLDAVTPQMPAGYVG